MRPVQLILVSNAQRTCLQCSLRRCILIVYEDGLGTSTGELGTRRCHGAKKHFTSGTVDNDMSSNSGSESSPLGSGLGAAAPLSFRGNIMSLRVTRNPRMKMHWSSGKSYNELKKPNSSANTKAFHHTFPMGPRFTKAPILRSGETIQSMLVFAVT